jgi:hypothetical protein
LDQNAASFVKFTASVIIACTRLADIRIAQDAARFEQWWPTSAQFVDGRIPLPQAD